MRALRVDGVWVLQQCSSSAVCGALRMRTIRDVDVRTMATYCDTHSPPPAVACVLPVCNCPNAAKKGWSRNSGFYLPGIGHGRLLEALNVVRLSFCSTDKLSGCNTLASRGAFCNRALATSLTFLVTAWYHFALLQPFAAGSNETGPPTAPHSARKLFSAR